MTGLRRVRARVLVGVPLILLVLALGVRFVFMGGSDAGVPGEPPEGPYRAFTPSSYWNTPLPSDAPIDPGSERFLRYLARKHAANFLTLSGTGPGGRWGNPIYWAQRGDPSYDIHNACSDPAPPEFRSVRIPREARADPTSDASMTIFDLKRGIVYGLWRARYDPGTRQWSACGGAAYYLRSNGLDGSLLGSNQPRNQGHRGVPPPTFAVRYDEITAGSIEHVLKIAVPRTACYNVFPLVGHECGTLDPAAPPEGMRLRLKPSIDLDAMDLTAAQRTIARALQRYGAVIGDQSGRSAELKLENTVAEGRGDLWSRVLTADSLSMFTFDDYEVIQLGYSPPPSVR